MPKKITEFNDDVKNGYVGDFSRLMEILQEQPISDAFKIGVEMPNVQRTDSN